VARRSAGNDTIPQSTCVYLHDRRAATAVAAFGTSDVFDCFAVSLAVTLVVAGFDVSAASAQQAGSSSSQQQSSSSAGGSSGQAGGAASQLPSASHVSEFWCVSVWPRCLCRACIPVAFSMPLLLRNAGVKA
jgi:hypothetical protein